MPERGERRLAILLCAAVAASVLALYAPARGFEFTNYDDPHYVAEKPEVQRGLDAEAVRWAFTTFDFGNWHPLTWLSHMLDWQLFGAHAGGHHATSVVLHAGNAVLLLLVLWRMTGALLASALAAALFALHPLQVDSVAWISERKNLLCAGFGLLALAAYLHHARRPGLARLALVTVCFALALLAKPALVPLPFLLLLLDAWPLRRARGLAAPGPAAGPLRSPGALLVEKLPLFAVALASSLVTLAAARAGGAMEMTRLALSTRAAEALVSYATYLRKLVLPTDLAVLYPHPGGRPAWQVAGAALLLAGLSALALGQRRRRPWLAVGWLWFLGLLVPTIGIVQVGLQSMADRYAYLPAVGIFVAVAFSLAAWGRERPRARPWLAAAACAALGLLAWQSSRQLTHWRDGVALFERAVAIAPSPAAHYNLGEALHAEGRHREALAQFEEAIRLAPDYAAAYNNAGVAALRLGDRAAARRHYARAVELAPDAVPFRMNRGHLLLFEGDVEGALAEFEAVLRAAPDHAEARARRGIALARLRRDAEALPELRAALARDPAQSETRLALARVLLLLGRADEAREQIAAVAAGDPDAARRSFTTGFERLRAEDRRGAQWAFELALVLDPGLVPALDGLAWILATDPDPARRDGEQAVALAERACERTGREHPAPLATLAAALAERGDFAGALAVASDAEARARALGRKGLADRIAAMQEAFRAGQGYRGPR
jgi:tetratricopeptide (TPR) repeat protein